MLDIVGFANLTALALNIAPTFKVLGTNVSSSNGISVSVGGALKLVISIGSLVGTSSNVPRSVNLLRSPKRTSPSGLALVIKDVERSPPTILVIPPYSSTASGSPSNIVSCILPVASSGLTGSSISSSGPPVQSNSSIGLNSIPFSASGVTFTR